MLDLDAFIARYAATSPSITFESWQSLRQEVLDCLRPFCLTMRDDQLAKLASFLELSASADLPDVLASLYWLSAFFYFFRDENHFSATFPTFLRHLASDNQVIVCAVIDTLLFLKTYYQEALALFPPIFAMLDEWFASDSHWPNIVSILTAARCAVPDLVIPLLWHWRSYFFRICCETRGAFRENALALFRFYCESLRDRTAALLLGDLVIRHALEATDTEKLIVALKTAEILVETHKISVPEDDILGKFLELDMYDRHLDLAAQFIIVARITPPDFLLRKVLRSYLIGDFMAAFPDRLDWQFVLNFVYENCAETCSEFCPYSVLEKAMIHGPLRPDPTRFDKVTPCDHFIDVLLHFEDLLSQPLVIHFEDAFCAMSNATSLIRGMKLLQKYPAKFANVPGIIQRLFWGILQQPIAVQLRFLDVVGLFPDIDERNRMILILSVADPNKQVRVKATTFLRITPVLSVHPMVFQALGDCSMRVKRRMFRHVAALGEYNPFETTAVVGHFVNTVLHDVQVVTDLRLAAKIASVFRSVAAKAPIRSIALCIKMLSDDSTIQVGSELDADRRDGYLVRTFARLGEACESRLGEILDVFLRLLTRRKNDEFLVVVVRSLSKLASKVFQGLNIGMKRPEMVGALYRILCRTGNDELSIEIIKLFGSAFDAVNCSETELFDAPATSPDVVRGVLGEVLRMNEISPRVLKVMAVAVETCPDQCQGLVPVIVKHMLNGLERLPALRPTIFDYLTLICQKVKNELLPYLAAIGPFLVRHVTIENAVRFAACCALSYLGEFTEIAAVLFAPVLAEFSSHGEDYFKYSIKFLAWAVIQQHQPIDIFVTALGKLANLSKAGRKKVVQALTAIVQYADVHEFLARIWAIARSMNAPTDNLILSMATYQRLTPLHLKYLCPNLTVQPVKEIVAGHMKERGIADNYHDPEWFFRDLEFSQHMKVGQFVMEVSQRVIARSPVPAVRACVDFPNYRSVFVRRVFPLAFSAVWQVASSADKDCFVGVLNHVLSEGGRLVVEVLRLLQFMDRNFEPIAIDLRLLAKQAPSHPYTFFLLQRRYLKGDHAILSQMLDTALQMNKMNTFGSYYRRCHTLEKIEDAKYARYLGDWEKALRLFREVNGKLPDIVNCLEQLKRFDEIRTLEPEFDALTDEKERNAVRSSFLSASIFAGDHEKIRKILASPSFDPDPKTYYFMVLYYISVGDCAKAQSSLQSGLSAIVQDRSVFIRGNQYEIQRELSYARLFHELQTVIDLKNAEEKSDLVMIRHIWGRRLQFFHHDEDAWEKLLWARNLVVPIRQHPEYYIKVMQALRRQGFFGLFNRYFRHQGIAWRHPVIMLEQIKSAWARGDRSIALAAARDSIRFIEIASEQDFVEALCRPDLQTGWRVLYRFILSPKTTQGIREMFLQHFAVDSIETGLQHAEKPESQEQVLAFLRKLVQTFPADAYRCFVHEMQNACYNTEWCWGVNHLYAKYVAGLNFDSFHAFRIADRYFRSALSYRGTAYESWCWLAYTNLRMCALLKADPSIAHWDAIEGYAVNYTSNAQIEGIPRIDTPRISHVEADSVLARIHSQQAMRHTSLAVKELPYDSVEVDRYGITAVTAYLKAMELRPDDSLRNLCQMFSVLFSLRNSSLFTEDFTRQILAIPSPRLVRRIPQIMGHLNHPEEGIRSLVSSLLLGIGKEYFQEVFFRLNVQRGDKQRASLLQILKTKHSRESRDAELFCDGMTRAAVTWFDSWKSALENASNWQSQQDDLLNERFAEFRRPRCQLDEYFVHLFGDVISECEQLFRSRHFGKMWDMFGQLYDQISEKNRQFSVIFLGKISQELAERKGFAIFVPDGEQTLLDSVDPVLDVLPTRQRPRSCHLIGASGRRVKFLLKGNEDLRVDERWMEYFVLINTFLKSRYDLSIVCYSIQPLAPDAGLVQWVAGADTLQQIVAAEPQRRDRPESPETAICGQFHHFASLDALQRLEVFEEICSKCRALELFEWIWLMSPNAASWVQHVERFTTSMASMSMVGYILGIGDRHPGNVMVQKETGSVVHIDFSDSLDAAVVRRAHPERVPFRLTRMIVNALEGSVTDGLFRRVCERVMEVLRKHRMTLGAHVVIFIGERAQMNTNRWCEPEHVTAARVVQKLAGTHLSEDGSEMSVRDHVKLLIEIAEDPRNYVRHFPGWCPFW